MTLLSFDAAVYSLSSAVKTNARPEFNFSKIMEFQIKLYRWPGSDSEVILLGRGNLAQEAAKTNIPEPDDLLYQALKNCFGEAPGANALNDTLIGQVRRSILESIKNGKPELRHVAGLLGLGPRTLQRRLLTCGVDFRDLTDETRCQLALNYLKDRTLKFTEIALRLGYSEVSAFNRAFKRWTGSTPLNYRRILGRSHAEKI